MPKKRILLLANSRKHQGNCLAGREIIGPVYGAGWIRPVSPRPGAEISLEESKYDDGSQPRPFDVIDVPLVRAQPFGCHTENWLISTADPWVKVTVASWDHVQLLAEKPPSLWGTGSSTNNGFNDQLLESEAHNFNTSITLIHVDKVEIRVSVPGQNFGNPKVRVQARFHYNGAPYWLWVTDVDAEKYYVDQGKGVYQLGECLLTISLAEATSKPNAPGIRYHYKLVAAIKNRI